MITVPALEYHLAHGCNLSCEQCSHYSNFRLQGKMPSPGEALEEYSCWNKRIRPRRFALLGGEPLLNPNLVEHISVARQAWPGSRLMLVTNGLMFDRHTGLPESLIENDCRLEISSHGPGSLYRKKFASAMKTVEQWKSDFPRLSVKIRKSYRGWMRQYKTDSDGKPVPYDSLPRHSYKVCMQKLCTNLFDSKLWKCPAIAYWKKLEQKLSLEDDPRWELFRIYQPLSKRATDKELKTFFSQKPIKQCRLCPAKRVSYRHPDPAVETLRKRR